MTAAAPYALLLDVDGPIASPATRTVTIPSITADLVTLANAGIPIAFNTGRSDAFVRDEVLAPMLAAGLRPDAAVHVVAEKGAVWASLTDGALGEPLVDHEMWMPDEYRETVRRLVESKYAESMFFDDSKLAMTSVEQVVGFPDADYPKFQDAFHAEAQRLLRAQQLEREFHIVPSIISVDIEHRSGGKALGAERAVELLRAAGTPVPKRWITAGDSRIDYDMARWLHRARFTVEHLDVRPAEGVPETPFPVRTEGESVNDAAGAAFLGRLVAELG